MTNQSLQDYLGNSITRYYIQNYTKCNSCRLYVWKDVSELDLCPKCILNLQRFELEIIFGNSKSKKYKQAVRLAKSIIGYSEKERDGKLFHIVKFRNLDEYNIECIENGATDKLFWLILEWKSFKITLNDYAITANKLISINHELEKIRLKQ